MHIKDHLSDIMYLDRGGLRCGHSQKHLGHLIDDQLCDQLLILLHVLTDQWHGAVHHLQRQKKSQPRCSGGFSMALKCYCTRWQCYPLILNIVCHY